MITKASLSSSTVQMSSCRHPDSKMYLDTQLNKLIPEQL